MADPKVSFDWSVYITYSKAETKAVAKYSRASSAAVAACQKVPNRVRNIPTRTLCRGTVAALAQSFHNTFKSAAKNNRCVQLRSTYTGALTQWKGVNC